MEKVCRYFLPDICKARRGNGYCTYGDLSRISKPTLFIKMAFHAQVYQINDAVPPIYVSADYCRGPKHCPWYTQS